MFPCRGNPAEQQAANKWLQEFVAQPQAAQAGLELLKPQQPADTQYFTANMLLTVVKQHWSRLDPELKVHVNSQLR